MATNDVGQLRQGLKTYLLHLYERFQAAGFSERASKQELVRILAEEMRDLTSPADRAYQLAPLASIAAEWMIAQATQLSEEYQKQHNPELKEEGTKFLSMARFLNTRRR